MTRHLLISNSANQGEERRRGLVRCHLFLLPTRHLSPAGPAGRGSNIISKLNYGLFARFISALKCMKKFQEVPVRTAVNNGERVFGKIRKHVIARKHWNTSRQHYHDCSFFKRREIESFFGHKAPCGYSTIHFSCLMLQTLLQVIKPESHNM